MRIPAGPPQTIIGSPDIDDLYTNADGAIVWGAPNPFPFDPSFLLDALGVPPHVFIEDVFGGAEDQDNDLSAVPEPATLALYGMALLGLPLGLLWTRRARRRPHSSPIV